MTDMGDPADGRGIRIDMALAVLASSTGALLAFFIGVPGGLMVGGTIGAAALTVARDRAVAVPQRMVDLSQILIGVTVGARITPDTLQTLRASVGPAVLASLLIIVAGVAVAWLLRGRGLSSEAALLATSPGGLDTLTVIALERKEGPTEVALFHIVRIVLVLLSVPVLLALLSRTS